MIIFNKIEAIEQFSQIELRQHILETISKITEGATYDPNIYGQFALVEAGDNIAEIEAKTGCRVMHDLFQCKNAPYFLGICVQKCTYQDWLYLAWA